MLVAREDLALEAAFWAQLPRKLSVPDARKSPITSRKPSRPWRRSHNYPAGARTADHQGRALTVLVTSASSPYHFSLHAETILSIPTEAAARTRVIP